MKCKNCGSYLQSWFPSNRVNSVAVDGRLKSNEISCDFVLGCDVCSETLRVVPAEEIASQMNADIELKRNPWSDIGTAPKDGRWILLGGGSYSDEAEGKSDVMVARWEPKQGNINEGWLVCAAECGYSCFYYENPTKWMEVPR